MLAAGYIQSDVTPPWRYEQAVYNPNYKAKSKNSFFIFWKNANYLSA